MSTIEATDSTEGDVPGSAGAGRGAQPGRRAPLDGLRTVAVYLVVLFHSGVDAVEGGFIGVDVFFVLSGYLVTGVLLDGRAVAGRTRFATFYARRIRRLLPASIVTLVATVAAFSALVGPVALQSIADSARAALLYVANWHFIGDATDYFADDVDRNPVLHFWSLAVEEQFYLLWPLLLTGLLLLGRRTGHPRRFAAAATATAAVASLSWALVLRGEQPLRAYFGTDTRAYQLLVGALLALVPAVIAGLSRRRRAAGACAVVGLGAIAVTAATAVAVDPVVRGVLATGAAALAIAGLEAAPRGVTSRVLGFDPVAYLGRISYATYLWHWPVAVALDDLVELSTPATVVVVAVLATALAALSGRLLEGPILRSEVLDRLPRAPVIAGGLALGLVAALIVVPRFDDASHGPGAAAVTGGFTPVPADFDQAAVYFERYGDTVDCSGGRPEDCTIVQGTGPHVLLIGDSNAHMLIPAFTRLAREEGLTLSLSVYSGCPWQRDHYVLSEDIQASCRRVKPDAYDRVIPALDPDVVIAMNTVPKGWRTTTYDETDSSQRELREATLASVDELGDGGRRRVVLLEPMPTAADPVDPLECLAEATYVEECRFVAWESTSWYVSLLREIDDSRDWVAAVDLDRLICPFMPICDPIVDGTVVFWNEAHITRRHSEAIAGPMAELLREHGVLDA